MPRLLRPILALTFAVLFTSCGSPYTGGSDPPEDAYKTVIAEAEADGLNIYWLGPKVEAGGLSYPYVGGKREHFGGTSTSGDSVFLTYYLIEDEDLDSALTVTSVPLDALSYFEGLVTRSLSRGADVESVSVAGFSGDLISTSSATRPVNERRLIVRTPTCFVFVQVASGGSPIPGGPDINPLVDRATFLAVMENLRPYPE